MTRLISIILHLLLAYAVLMAARVVYVMENWSAFSTLLADNSPATLLRGSLLFDTSLVLYSGSVVVVALTLLPARRIGVATWLFTAVNAVCLAMNLADAVYFKYTGHRTTMSVFSEFSNEGNLAKVLLAETLAHWYLFCVAALLTAAMFYASRGITRRFSPRPDEKLWRQSLLLLLFIPLCVTGIRGGIGRAVRPVTISNANQYVAHPAEAAVVLNTPFSMLRTIGKNVFRDPAYFTAARLDKIYSPVHRAPSDSLATPRRKNVVVIIVESFGREYIGAFNRHLEGGAYKGYTPFVDSLCSVSLTFDYSYANGRKSIDGMPGILSGIPHFVEPFFLTPASMNDVGGMAASLATEGYTTAFFHGAANGSMGFEAFAKATGFQTYYGRTEFEADPRYGGAEAFDGTWAIWDEPFLQFYAEKMTEMRQPFITTVFTASSHHPYRVPEEYAQRFADRPIPQRRGVVRTENPIHKCIEYTDMALRRFFETARRQPWYMNTVFVITSDHTNIFDHDEYATDLGLFAAPILFFDPSDEMPRGRSRAIAQHTDIMPTMLSYLGCRKPYVAWGIDLLNTPPEETWAVSYNAGIYQLVCRDILIQHDGTTLKAVYLFRTDPLLRHNLVATMKDKPQVKAAETKLKAIIQTYMQRMNDNRLVVRE